jgi:hypothetical protein
MGNTGDGGAVAEAVEFSEGKQALLQVEGKAVCGKDGEKRPQVFPMLLLGLSVHTVII